MFPAHLSAFPLHVWLRLRLPLKMQNATVAAVNHFFIEIYFTGEDESLPFFYAQFFLNRKQSKIQCGFYIPKKPQGSNIIYF